MRSCDHDELFEFTIPDSTNLHIYHQCHVYKNVVNQNLKHEIHMEFNHLKYFYLEDIVRESSLALPTLAFSKHSQIHVVYDYLQNYICNATKEEKMHIYQNGENWYWDKTNSSLYRNIEMKVVDPERQKKHKSRLWHKIARHGLEDGWYAQRNSNLDIFADYILPDIIYNAGLEGKGEKNLTLRQMDYINRTKESNTYDNNLIGSELQKHSINRAQLIFRSSLTVIFVFTIAILCILFLGLLAYFNDPEGPEAYEEKAKAKKALLVPAKKNYKGRRFNKKDKKRADMKRRMSNFHEPYSLEYEDSDCGEGVKEYLSKEDEQIGEEKFSDKKNKYVILTTRMMNDQILSHPVTGNKIEETKSDVINNTVEYETLTTKNSKSSNLINVHDFFRYNEDVHKISEKVRPIKASSGLGFQILSDRDSIDSYPSRILRNSVFTPPRAVKLPKSPKPPSTSNKDKSHDRNKETKKDKSENDRRKSISAIDLSKMVKLGFKQFRLKDVGRQVSVNQINSNLYERNILAGERTTK